MAFSAFKFCACLVCLKCVLKECVNNMGQFLFLHSLLKLTVLWVADVEMRNVEMRNATIKQAQHVCRQFSRGAVVEVAEK